MIDYKYDKDNDLLLFKKSDIELKYFKPLAQ
jgi:hypothetical protein